MHNSYDIINTIRITKGYAKLALIDPDLKNDPIINNIIKSIHDSDFDAILIGGSSVHKDGYESRINLIKNSTSLPIMLFPGSASQITENIDTILYLNLVSGRNPKYLIEEHVEGAMKIYDNNIHVIPTAYILLDGGSVTSVAKVSQTVPLNMENKEEVLKHALAGQYLGNKIIYLDCGSGSKNNIKKSLLEYIHSFVDIPIMVGGGINTDTEINELIDNGASYIVCGTKFEKNII